MRSIIVELHDSVLGFLTTDDDLLDSPKFRQKSRGDYAILAGNFYFRKTADIHSALQRVCEITENTIRSHIREHGEIITSTIQKGEIWDSGKKYFEIKAGSIIEAYCFDCKSLTFVRVTWEKQLFGAEKEWLSIDADHFAKTLWFEER